jgi:hypothetical protein
MVKETEQRKGWKRGIIVQANSDGHIMAIEEVGKKYIGRRFALDLGDYRIPVPSKENFLDWGDNRAEKRAKGEDPGSQYKPVRNESIHFEFSADGKIVGWCSNFDFLKAKIVAKKMFKTSCLIPKKGVSMAKRKDGAQEDPRFTDQETGHKVSRIEVKRMVSRGAPLSRFLRPAQVRFNQPA